MKVPMWAVAIYTHQEGELLLAVVPGKDWKEAVKAAYPIYHGYIQDCDDLEEAQISAGNQDWDFTVKKVTKLYTIAPSSPPYPM